MTAAWFLRMLLPARKGSGRWKVEIAERGDGVDKPREGRVVDTCFILLESLYGFPSENLDTYVHVFLLNVSDICMYSYDIWTPISMDMRMMSVYTRLDNYKEPCRELYRVLCLRI